jgi:hypothetical protein
MNFHFVAFVPASVNGNVSFVKRAFYRLPVYRDVIAQAFFVGIGVQVAGNNLSTDPSGIRIFRLNPVSFGCNFQTDISGPGSWLFVSG